MTVNQIYELINSVSQQTFGQSAPITTDLSGLISLGETLNSSSDKDKFLNTLVDRIGKTIIRTLDLSVKFPKIMMNDFEFGAVLQKITAEPLTAVESEPWKVGGVSYTPNQFAISKPNVRQSLFSGKNVWSVKVTIPDNLFKTAFTSNNDMGAFINAIIDSMQKSMITQISEMNRMCVVNFIGKKISTSNSVVHLATLYNEDMEYKSGDTGYVDVYNARFNAEFARYSGMIIRNYIKYLSEPSTMFNNAGVVRETQRDNMHVFMNADFASSYSTYLQSGTFHKELTELPLYEEITQWQSLKTIVEGANNPSFVSATSINVKLADSAAGDDAISQNGIICVLADRYAIGTTAYNVRTTTDRNNDGEYTNYSHKCDIGYFNDMTENGVVFVID